MKSFIWFLIGVIFGWVIIASMFPSVGDAMFEEGFFALAIVNSSFGFGKWSHST